jgi:hypothetical protein
VGAGGGSEPTDVLGEGAQPGAVEREDARDVRPAAQRDGEGRGDGELVCPPARQQFGVPVGGQRLTGAEHHLGQLERDRGVAEQPPGLGVATPVGVAGHARDQAVVLEQEHARALRLAEFGQQLAGRREQVLGRLGPGGGLDQSEQHLCLRQPPGLRPARPGR